MMLPFMAQAETESWHESRKIRLNEIVNKTIFPHLFVYSIYMH